MCNIVLRNVIVQKCPKKTKRLPDRDDGRRVVKNTDSQSNDGPES